MRVFFGHQSVGQNIVDELAAHGDPSYPSCLDLDHVPDDGSAELLHARIGTNGDPFGKIDDFVARAPALHAAGVDTAMMKLCYADIGTDTDTRALLDHYARGIDALRERCPDLRIAHVTTPLRRMPLGLRALARRVLRRPEGGLHANAARDAYNDGLRERLGDREPVFDLAGVEARHPDGRAAVRRHGSRAVPSLAPEYTDDGGHLNAAGRATVAGAFARFLRELDAEAPPATGRA